MDYGDLDEGLAALDRPLDDPAFRLDHECDLAGQLPDHYAGSQPHDPAVSQGRVEVRVAPDDLQPLDRLMRPVHQWRTADLVLDVGRNDPERPDQPQRIDGHELLAARCLFSPS